MNLFHKRFKNDDRPTNKMILLLQKGIAHKWRLFIKIISLLITDEWWKVGAPVMREIKAMKLNLRTWKKVS